MSLSRGAEAPFHTALAARPPAPDHTVQFYESDEQLVASVGHYLVQGITLGESAVAVATPAHLKAFEELLERRRIDPAQARKEGRWVPLDAHQMLARLLPDDSLQEEHFRSVLDPLLRSAVAASTTSRVRIFGEMVDVLWGQGKHAQTLQLEQLWNQLAGAWPFALLCAYRLDGAGAAQQVRNEHSGVVGEAYPELTPEQQRYRLAELEQRARTLEAEVVRRRAAEAERALFYEAERAARAETSLLYSLTDAANRADTVEQVYEAALSAIEQALGVSRASILLFDSDGVIRFKAWRGLSDEYRAAVEGHSPWRAEDKDPMPLLVKDVHQEESLAPYRALFEKEGIGALGFFPLITGGRLLGKFMVYYPGIHPFGAPETHLAGAIAHQVAFAVDRQLALQERERVLGIVGHDLRNPLGAVMASAQALLKLDVSQRLTKPVRRIVTSAERMERLIAQLLDFALARQGTGIPIHRRLTSLREIAQHAVEEIEAAYPGRDVLVTESGNCHGEWDADRLAEVFSNLVGNAVQHGSTDRIEVRLRGEPTEVVLEVHNMGPPVPPALLPQLFDPFRRGTAGDTGRSQSVGLGLYITREIARAHGGGIDVRSNPDEGTTFTVRLPRTGFRAR